MEVIKFKDWVLNNINESMKNDKLNDILDKISNGVSISNSEQSFLDNFDSITTGDMQDFSLLNRSDVYDKVNSLLENNKVVIYFDEIVIDVKYIEDDICIVTKSSINKLKDNCLYNLVYDFDSDNHVLKIHDEYYEKLPLKND